jgi:type II secretory ATPase GspE/PulE/Tfp pilus assembly ATPase PilB-like protein
MSVLSVDGQQRLEDVLVKGNMLSADRLAEAKAAAHKATQPLVTYLVKNNYITDEQLTKANATITKVPYVNLTAAKIDPGVLALLPQDIAQRYMAVPLGEMQHRLVVAMLDADNVQAVDFLSNRIGRPLKVYVASESGIRQVLRQYEARLDTQMGAAFETMDKAKEATATAAAAGDKPGKAKAIEDLVEDSPISKALSAILDFAGRNRASDIHIEPLEKELKIR